MGVISCSFSKLGLVKPEEPRLNSKRLAREGNPSVASPVEVMCFLWSSLKVFNLLVKSLSWGQFAIGDTTWGWHIRQHNLQGWWGIPQPIHPVKLAILQRSFSSNYCFSAISSLFYHAWRSFSKFQFLQVDLKFLLVLIVGVQLQELCGDLRASDGEYKEENQGWITWSFQTWCLTPPAELLYVLNITVFCLYRENISCCWRVFYLTVFWCFAAGGSLSHIIMSSLCLLNLFMFSIVFIFSLQHLWSAHCLQSWFIIFFTWIL